MSAGERMEFRFSIVLALVVVTFLLLPFFIQHTLAARFAAVLITLTIAGGVYALSQSTTWRNLALALIIVKEGSAWLAIATQAHWATALALAAHPLFFGFAVVFIARRILILDRVTTDTVLAGICAYLLIGVLWTGFYANVEFYVPGSFLEHGQTGAIPGFELLSGPRATELLYFSFVTLTTLGYGDITPATPTAGVLAALEAMTGQLYVAVLIARLVALHTVAGGESD